MSKKLLALFFVFALAFGSLMMVQGCAPADEGPTDGETGEVTEEGEVVEEMIKLKIATDAAYPPFESIDTKTSEIVGFDIDFMKAIADAAGFEVEFVSVDWEGILIGLDAEKYDAVISAVSITEERKKEYDYSEPYYAISQALLLKTEDAEGITILDDLATKKIGAQNGTTGAIFIDNNKKVKLVPYKDNALAIEALIRGDVAAVVCDHPVAFDYALKNNAYKGKLTVVNSDLNKGDLEEYGIVVKKGNSEILELINKGLAEVKKGDKISELEKKWGIK